MGKSARVQNNCISLIAILLSCVLLRETQLRSITVLWTLRMMSRRMTHQFFSNPVYRSTRFATELLRLLTNLKAKENTPGGVAARVPARGGFADSDYDHGQRRDAEAGYHQRG